MADTSNEEVPLCPIHAERREALDLDCVIVNRDSNDSAPGPAFLLAILAYFSRCSGDNESVSVANVAGKFGDEIAEFMKGVQEYFKSIFGKKLQEDVAIYYRLILSDWNTFLQPSQGVPSDIKDNINEFIERHKAQRGEQWTDGDQEWIEEWIPRWNMFLKARTGRALVTRCSVNLTTGGFTLYILDQVSDILTAIYYACNGQWWPAMATLCFFYLAVFMNTWRTWRRNETHCTSTVECLCYIPSLLVNGPDVKLYWSLYQLERQLHESPETNARLVPEWHRKSYNVALLKLTEGIYESHLQAMLQLFLLTRDLYGAWTWIDYLRIVSVTLSLCSAALSLVNREKCWRLLNYIDVPLSAQVVLHVWAVSVTVSRLMSFPLIQTVHLYWHVVGGGLHIVLFGVYWCTTEGVPRTWEKADDMYRFLLHYYASPFDVVGSVSARRVSHTLHFLVNTALTVLWAIYTPLLCAHPALYTAIICFTIGMFAVGVGAWQLYEKHWPDSYPKYKREYWMLSGFR